MGAQLSVNAKGVDEAFFLAGGVNTPLIGQFANFDTKFVMRCDPSTRGKWAFNAGRVYGAFMGQFANVGTVGTKSVLKCVPSTRDKWAFNAGRPRLITAR